MNRSLASAFIVVVWVAVLALRTAGANLAISSYRPSMNETEQARLLNDTDSSCPTDDDSQADAGWPDSANGTRAPLVRQRYSQSNYLISSAGIASNAVMQKSIDVAFLGAESPSLQLLCHCCQASLSGQCMLETLDSIDVRSIGRPLCP